MYKASATIIKFGKRNTLILQDKTGLTANKTKRAHILTRYFSKQLSSEFADTLQEIPPIDMKVPFSPEEIIKALKSMKNNKSPGIDEINLQHLKCGCEEKSEWISKIFDIVARTGHFPIEIKQGLLVPIQKRDEKRGLPEYLRSIILMSVLRNYCQQL